MFSESSGNCPMQVVTTAKFLYKTERDKGIKKELILGVHLVGQAQELTRSSHG